MASELAYSEQSRQAGHGARVPGGDRETEVSPAELLELLGDEYTREVLGAVSEKPRSGREVAEATSVSKPTAFRRLNRLEEAGLVAVETQLDPDGHHHKQFRAVLEGATVRLDDDGLGMDVRVERGDRKRREVGARA